MGSKLSALERKIARLSAGSKLAPPEFLRSELTRFITIQQVRAVLPREIWPESFMENLELEFQIYFAPETTRIELHPSWKHVYGGSDAVIEIPIWDAGLKAALPKLGLGYIRDDKIVNRYKFVEQIGAGVLPKLVRRFFVSTGFLYPNSDGTLQVHGNVRLAQYGSLINAGGNAFLSRDQLRRPFYEADCDQASETGLGPALNEKELWKFWGDNLALELSGTRTTSYWRDSFRRKERGLPLKRNLREVLELGHCLVPQRYVCPEPQIEAFSWTEDSLGKYLNPVTDKLEGNLKQKHKNQW